MCWKLKLVLDLVRVVRARGGPRVISLAPVVEGEREREGEVC